MFVKIKKLTKINNSNICYLSKNIYYKLNLNKNKKYKINIGNISKYLYIHPKNIDESMMCFPKNIFNYFLLFSNIKLNIWKKNDDLILGPILGVFVNEKYMKRIKDDNPSKTCLRLIWQVNSPIL